MLPATPIPPDTITAPVVAVVAGVVPDTITLAMVVILPVVLIVLTMLPDNKALACVLPYILPDNMFTPLAKLYCVALMLPAMTLPVI